METNVKLETGRFLRITSFSAREIQIRHHPLSKVNLTTDVFKNIIGINIDGFEVNIDNPLKVKLVDRNDTYFKPKSIKEGNNDYTYHIFSTNLTKTARWIMPMIGRPGETQTNYKYDSYFVNAYLGTNDTGYMREIYLVYRFSGSLEFRNLDTLLTNNELFDRQIELDSYHTMYIFTIPEHYLEDYFKFIEGKYSLFSDNYKKQILSFLLNPSIVSHEDVKKSLTYGVLYKTNRRKEQLLDVIGREYSEEIKTLEYYSIPKEEEELYMGDIEITQELPIEAARDES